MIMNNLRIEEWGHYRTQTIIWEYIEDLYVIRKMKISDWILFPINVDWITYTNHENWSYEKTMTVKKFNRIALYQVTD